MSRFLVTCWPFEGHVYGQIGIAGALRERGHDVAFYTDESRRELVEGEGFAFFPFERLQRARFERVHELEERTSTKRKSLRLQREAFRNWLVESIPEQIDDISAILADWPADAIVTDLSMWAPPLILWEAARVPVAISSTMMGPMIPGRDAPPWGFAMAPPTTAVQRLRARVVQGGMDLLARGVRRRVDELRAAHGLAPMGCSINAFTGRLPLYLVPSVRELDYGRTDLPPSVHYVGSCQWHPPLDDDEDAWLWDVPTERPWVHVTEGTSHHQEPLLLPAATRGLADEPVEVVLTTGRGRDPDSLGLAPLPANVHATRWLSHGALMPRCAAVVTTGGQGTVLSALQAGVPLVVVPTTWDKPDNARRVVHAGAGVMLAPRRCTPESLRAGVREVLSDPAYAASARRLGRLLTDGPGPGGAAELLAALPARRSCTPVKTP